MVTLSYSQEEQRQDFHRFYFAENEQLNHLASVPRPSGGFYMANVRFIDNTNEVYLSVSKHNIKGNVDWARAYEIEDAVYEDNFKNLDLVLNGSALFVLGYSAANDDVSEYFALKLDVRNGDITWSNILHDQNTSENILSPPVGFVGFENETNIATTLSGDVNGTEYFGIHLEGFDGLNESVTSRSYLLEDENNNLFSHSLIDAVAGLDTSFLMLSNIENNDLRYGIIQTDRSGNIVQASQYNLQNMSTVMPRAMVSQIDTTTIVVGDYVEGAQMGFVAKTDSIGNLMWLVTSCGLSLSILWMA